MCSLYSALYIHSLCSLSLCLSDHVSAHASIDFIDACETLRKELLKSMKIAKKFKEELKLANHEKEEFVVRLDESNKKNEF